MRRLLVIEILTALIIIVVPIVILLTLVGRKYCFFCGDAVTENEKPVYSFGHVSCPQCAEKNEDVK